MSETRYSKDHEWVRKEEDDTVTIGITDYAQKELGDIVFVDLPGQGDEFNAGEEIAVIESVKAAEGLKTPVSGEVAQVNDALEVSPETVNNSPEGDGWFCKLELTEPSEFSSLMSEDEYSEYVSGLE